jgi:hypothetical protein
MRGLNKQPIDLAIPYMNQDRLPGVAPLKLSPLFIIITINILIQFNNLHNTEKEVKRNEYKNGWKEFQLFKIYVFLSVFNDTGYSGWIFIRDI